LEKVGLTKEMELDIFYKSLYIQHDQPSKSSLEQHRH